MTKAGNGDWGHSLVVVDMLNTQEVRSNPPPWCTHTKLYGRDLCACASVENHLYLPHHRSTAATHLMKGKILRSWGPLPWLQGLSPPPLIDGHLGQRCSGLLSPGTALLGQVAFSNPGSLSFGFCYRFHLTATSMLGYNSASLGSHTESKACTPGVSENSYVCL